MTSYIRRIPFWSFLLLILLAAACSRNLPLMEVQKGQTLVLIGNNLAARMMQYGYFEAALQSRYPDSLLRIRNMGDGGNTPGFRPHAGRATAWAFPAAKELLVDLYPESGSEGHFEYPDQWLERLKADVILAFFGYNEVFRPEEYKTITEDELRAFVGHTLSNSYNGAEPPHLILISPIALEPQPANPRLSDFSDLNEKLETYTSMMRRVAAETGVGFLDLFHPSQQWYASGERFTLDGLQLNDKGNQKLAEYLAEKLAGIPGKTKWKPEVLRAVQDKNWFWGNDFKIPNGVHVFGRRYNPFGPDNYPYELEKIRQMTAIRDTAIWMAAQGSSMDIKAADARTRSLPAVTSNYDPQANGHGGRYRYGQEALESFEIAPGYEIQLFASEREFPELANPVQLSFDDHGRLWVATMPSYPHYKPGDPRPDDKLVILEDTNEDGRADTLKVWADGLHLPVGFELSPEGVYISQSGHLKLFRDTDGDDRADTSEILLSGFDDHDTHHAISAFTADPFGAIYMGEGTFLHTNVETPYGPVRGTHGGFYRYNPRDKHLERTAQLPIPNPWGIAFDDWGQPFFLDTSGPALRWMLPGTLQPEYGKSHPLPSNLVPDGHQVRPTAGLEFVSSGHFPDSVQGDVLLCNSIGFLGIKQHAIMEEGTGYRMEFRQDLLRSTDPNFRPVDLEFAPDGTLYVVDWHNMLIGHMQHNARDPYRDHSHGRIYRITHSERPTLPVVSLAELDLPSLLELLKSEEDRMRYRVRRTLRGLDPDEVARALSHWVSELDPKEAGYQHHLLEALWVGCGVGRTDTGLLNGLLESRDHRVRAAAVRALRYSGYEWPDLAARFKTAAADPHGRVRLEALVAASWREENETAEVLEIAAKAGLDSWIEAPYEAIRQRISGDEKMETDLPVVVPEWLDPGDSTRYIAGREIYLREGYCATCHQADGLGLPSGGFPPLGASSWVTGSEERLIKLTLKGLTGPMMVNGHAYEGTVPMTAFEGLLNDQEIADVLTYIRNAFGNRSTPIHAETIQRIRKAEKDRKRFYHTSELK